MKKTGKYDVVALGELNVDIILNRIDGFPEIGKEKFAGDMTVTLGSSTAIFAANVACLGSKTAFAGMIGDDSFGSLVEKSLAAKGVDTGYLIKSGKYATGATIVMSFGEDRANLTYQGAMDHMGFADLDRKLFEEAKHIHISSIFMQSELKRDLPEVFAAAEAAGVTLSMDTQWDPVEKWDFDFKSLLPHIDIFMPNETELGHIVGTSDLDAAVAAIVPYLKRAAVIKCGSRGSLLVGKDGSTHMLPSFLNRNVVDAIGAGDSFNAGFIHGFVKGLELTECQRLGNLSGAVNTTAAGGTGAFTSKEAFEKTASEVFGVSFGA